MRNMNYNRRKQRQQESGYVMFGANITPETNEEINNIRDILRERYGLVATNADIVELTLDAFLMLCEVAGGEFKGKLRGLKFKHGGRIRGVVRVEAENASA